MYSVKVARHVSKYIEKLGSKEKDYFINRFNELKYNKSGYRQLDRYKNIELWELRCSNHRVYYTVENQFIIIENIEYEGNINVQNAGNKNRQQGIIDYEKNKMRNNYTKR